MTTSIDLMVAKGMALLDKEAPGWEDMIDPHQLNIASPRFCVLGQLMHVHSEFRQKVVDRMSRARLTPYPNYWGLDFGTASEYLEAQDWTYRSSDYGFSDRLTRWDALNQAWKKAILDRRKAKLPQRVDFVLTA